MRLISRSALAIGLLASINAHAVSEQWTPHCETITGVVNEISASTPSVLLVLSPPINIANGAAANCSSGGVAGTLSFIQGSGGVTASNINTYLASSLSAFNAGHQVLIFYDYSTTSSCYGIEFADGGYDGSTHAC